MTAASQSCSPVYDEANRCHIANGVPVPSVTQILKATGVTSDFRHVDPDVLARKARLGQAVHAAAHYYDDGDLVASSVAPEVEPYLEAWIDFRRERRFIPTQLETVVYSPIHHYIGRFDRLGHLAPPGDERIVLGDIKIGDPDAAAADLQLAGYLAALREEQPEFHECPIERWSVQLCETGKYKLCKYPKPGRTDRLDRADFRALARTINLRCERQGGQTPCWT